MCLTYPQIKRLYQTQRMRGNLQKMTDKTQKTTETMKDKKKKVHYLKNVRKKNVIEQDITRRRWRIITFPSKDDNLLAHATPSLVAIAPQSIFVRASEKGAAEDRGGRINV
ncbi:unnamed protein product [Toxocara canis]|uniref:Uncharacterized protein n=1 Tax=Toxocara canis TaxID=6265 RepID=A0A183U5A4_TOXCA|nr:unnamed protein product [Toxocara canis]